MHLGSIQARKSQQQRFLKGTPNTLATGTVYYLDSNRVYSNIVILAIENYKLNILVCDRRCASCAHLILKDYHNYHHQKCNKNLTFYLG